MEKIIFCIKKFAIKNFDSFLINLQVNLKDKKLIINDKVYNSYKQLDNSQFYNLINEIIKSGICKSVNVDNNINITDDINDENHFKSIILNKKLNKTNFLIGKQIALKNKFHKLSKCLNRTKKINKINFVLEF